MIMGKACKVVVISIVIIGQIIALLVYMSGDTSPVKVKFQPSYDKKYLPKSNPKAEKEEFNDESISFDIEKGKQAVVEKYNIEDIHRGEKNEDTEDFDEKVVKDESTINEDEAQPLKTKTENRDVNPENNDQQGDEEETVKDEITTLPTPILHDNETNEQKFIDEQKSFLQAEWKRINEAKKSLDIERNRQLEMKSSLQQESARIRQKKIELESLKLHNVKLQTLKPAYVQQEEDEKRAQEEERLLKQQQYKEAYRNFDGLDIDTVQQRYPGIHLSPDYRLKEFIDLNDPTAAGMSHRPETISDMSDADAEERFYQLVTTEHLKCDRIRRVGNVGDGGWDVCVSEPYLPKEPCLVYSFGINNDWSFDDSITQIYGCEDMAFDPSMGMRDHLHSDKVSFYNLGLGEKNTRNSNNWELKTLKTIMETLQHSTRIIDFLKIDIEFNEWKSLENMLEDKILANVKQFAFEIHTTELYGINRPSTKWDFFNQYNTLLNLEKQGFRRYHYHYNPMGKYRSVRTGKERTCCYELYYINLRFLKS